MKSKEEMQKVIVALAMATMTRDGKKITDLSNDEASKARAVMDVLLWVMDYPNNFRKFAEPTIEICPVTGEKLEEVFNEAVSSWETKDTGGHSE